MAEKDPKEKDNKKKSVEGKENEKDTASPSKKKILKDIKDKISKNTADSEIIGKPEYKNLKDDLIPIDSIWNLDPSEAESLSSEISKHINSVANSYERDDRYGRYKLALRNSEIEGVLQIYASEVCTQDNDGKIFNISCSSERVVKILERMFVRVGLQDKSFDIVQNFCAYGDEFYEIIYSKNGKNIHSLNRIPRDLIGRQEENGVLQHFFIRKSKKMSEEKDSLYSFSYTGQSKEDEEKKIDPFRILHWRIPSSEYAPYGKSILDSVIVPIEELRLLEQSLLIARITRAPERRIFSVNVGQAQGEKGTAIAREIVRGLKKKKIIDKTTNSLDTNIDFMGSSEDIVIPFRRDEEKSTVDTLQQLNDPGQLNDLEFVRDRIFPGLGVPRQYLYDDTFANANTNLSNKSVQFNKRMLRIQKYHLYPIYKLAYIELRLNNVAPKEYEDLKITMNNPSNIDMREKLEIETSKWGLISTIKALNAEKVFYNDFQIYKEFLGKSNEEVLDLMIQNIAQEGTKNPFSFLPEEERPEDFEILDQLRGGGDENQPGTGEDGEVPNQAAAAFGGGEEGGEATPPEEGAETPAPEGQGTPEGGEEIEVASYGGDKGNTDRHILLEMINRAKKIKQMQNKKPLKEKKKLEAPIYTEDYLSISREFQGIETFTNNLIFEEKTKKRKKVKNGKRK